MPVDLFITLGSPLMLLGFKQGIIESQHDFPHCAWPVVTENIRAWKNFADWHDPIVMKSVADLRDSYLTKEGEEIIEDFLVENTYTRQNENGEHIRNHHKSYGYLRSPEVSETIKDFLLG